MGTLDYYQVIMDSMPQLVVIAEKTTNPKTKQNDFLVSYVNKAWESLMGSLVSTIVGKFFSETIYAQTDIPLEKIAKETLVEKKSIQNNFYSLLLDKWLFIQTIYLEKNLLCLNIFDITETNQKALRLREQNQKLSLMSSELAASKNNLKKKLIKIEALNKELEKIAYYDALTGLPNRAKFTKTIEQEIKFAQKKGYLMGLAFLGVDNLKTINDTMGHNYGDFLIKSMAKRINHFSLQVSRFGGDEFLLLVKGFKTEANIVELLTKIHKKLNKPYVIENLEIKTSVSIGISLYPQDAQNAEDLLKNADIAMTEAKKCGKNCLVNFHTVMGETLKTKALIEQKLFSACEHNKFNLFYQPQFDVITKELRGFEALIRWFDPELGYISPEQFIPIAEENRLIIPIGNWVLKTACQTLAKWKKDFGFTGLLSVNVSPIQLKNADFINTLHTILLETQIDAQNLELEITEGIFLENFDETLEFLQEIKKLGVGISLDDFGTGYSSLSYLPKIPLTTLKIDKSFIENITSKSSLEYDLTNAIVALVTKQGINTVAEGVETAEQFEFMKLIKCKTIQGFLTGKPMPKSDCDTLLQDIVVKKS